MTKAGKKEKDLAKSYHSISLVRCLKKKLEKIVDWRIPKYVFKIEAITLTPTGCQPQQLVQDALHWLLTLSQELLTEASNREHQVHRLSIRATNIEDSFNSVRHNRPSDVMTLGDFPAYITNWTKDFCTNQTIRFHCDNQLELPKTCNSGLPQRSPLSPIRLVRYTTLSITKSRPPNIINCVYVDEDRIQQYANNRQSARQRLEEKLQGREN